MQNIIIKPSDLWGYYEENKSEFAECMIKAAENQEFGVSVWIEADEDCVYIVVECDGSEVHREDVTKSDAERTANRIYDVYLTSKIVDVIDDGYGVSRSEIIYEREFELDMAFSDLFDIVADGCSGIIPENVMNDIKNHTLEYMARKWKIDIYRPMILEDDETGEDYFTEYPYDEIVYEDEDNPVYK